MKKSHRYLFAVAAVIMMLALAGCGAAFDPVAFVQGGLDAAIQGNVTEEFIDSVDDVNSVEEFEADYSDMLDFVTNTTLTAAGYTEAPESIRADLKDMFATVMKNTKYEVTGEYTEEGDGYSVEVIAYPLLTYMSICNDEDGTVENAALARCDASMSMDEILTVYMEEMINAMNIALENPEYGEAQTFNIAVVLDDEGYYTVDENDIEELTGFLLGM